MTVLLTIHLIVTLALIGIILLQKSDGGAALMGASSTSSMFSARGAANLLTHTTAVLAAVFLALCIFMTWLSANQSRKAAAFLDSPASQSRSVDEKTTQAETAPSTENVPAKN